MSEFKRTQAALDAISDRVSALESESSAPVGSSSPGLDVSARAAALDAHLAELEALAAAVGRLKARTQEKDPISGDMRYGPKMQQKVLTVCILHDSLLSRVSSARQALNGALSIFEQQREAAAEEAQAQRQLAAQR